MIWITHYHILTKPRPFKTLTTWSLFTTQTLVYPIDTKTWYQWNHRNTLEIDQNNKNTKLVFDCYNIGHWHWARRNFPLQPWWWCTTHIGAGEVCCGAQWGSPSTNVTKISHPPKLVWHPMLIMMLLVISIGSVQYVMDMLVDMKNALNKVVIPVKFSLKMSWIYLSSCKFYSHINGT